MTEKLHQVPKSLLPSTGKQRLSCQEICVKFTEIQKSGPSELSCINFPSLQCLIMSSSDLLCPLPWPPFLESKVYLPKDTATVAGGQSKQSMLLASSLSVPTTLGITFSCYLTQLFSLQSQSPFVWNVWGQKPNNSRTMLLLSTMYFAFQIDISI